MYKRQQQICTSTNIIKGIVFIIDINSKIIDAVNYRENHPELTMAEVANNLGILLSPIHRWIKEYSSNSDDESKVFRGSGNYSSDDAKELARLKKENGNLRDAVEILKKL